MSSGCLVRNQGTRCFFGFVLVALLASSAISSSRLEKTKEQNSLPETFRKWLDEEVVYIIAPREGEVFLKLKTDHERDLFIGAFWKHRNPNPLADANEFRDEHYRRLDYVSRNFGRGTGVPGWRTDRGRIYIKLGAPTSIQDYEGSSLFPTVVWYYQGMSKFGLPDVFNIVFFKKRGTGDYRLYSPSADGPESLVANYSLSQYSSAYQAIRDESPALAQVVLSLVPGEAVLSETPPLASDRLLLDINDAPYKLLKDEYAEKFLLYKDIVEVDYSANYIESTSSVSVLRDSSGVFFVNYLIELDRFSVNQLGDKYSTRLAVNGKVSDADGKTIFQFDREVPVEFNQSHFEIVKAQKYCFEDLFPLIEGHNKFSLLVKNEASKEFTSLEKDIVVPKGSAQGMSKLILAYRAEKDTKPQKLKAFEAGGQLLSPSLRLDFSQRDTIYVYFQLFGLSEEMRKEGSLKLGFFKGEEEFRTQKEDLKDLPVQNFVLREFSTADFLPDYYNLRVSLCDKDGKVVISDKSPFTISPSSILPRPWVTALFHLPSIDPGYSYILGRQWQSKGDIEKATSLLEKAYKATPSSLQFALGYSGALFAIKDYKSIAGILMPFLEQGKYEVLEPLARAYQGLGETEGALSLFRQNLAHFGLNILILNEIGGCYYRLGNKGESLKAWQKSIEINPNQEEIKSLIKKLGMQ